MNCVHKYNTRKKYDSIHSIFLYSNKTFWVVVNTNSVNDFWINHPFFHWHQKASNKLEIYKIEFLLNFKIVMEIHTYPKPHHAYVGITGILGNIVIVINYVLNVEKITYQILVHVALRPDVLFVVFSTLPIIEVDLIIKSLNVLVI